jgi:hypothetical protein
MSDNSNAYLHSPRTLAAANFKILRRLDNWRRLRLGLPVTLHGPNIPYGYHQSDYDENIYVIDEEILADLIEMVNSYHLYNTRDMASYLTAKHKDKGFNITHSGMQRLIHQRPFFKEASLPLDERMKLEYTTI